MHEVYKLADEMIRKEFGDLPRPRQNKSYKRYVVVAAHLKGFTSRQIAAEGFKSDFVKRWVSRWEEKKSLRNIGKKKITKEMIKKVKNFIKKNPTCSRLRIRNYLAKHGIKVCLSTVYRYISEYNLRKIASD